MDKDDKVKYVKRQGQTRDHHCHWPGCDRQVSPAMWGCKRHWFMLPKHMRDRVWATFRPGQEKNWTPSREYVTVAREVQAWINSRHGDGASVDHGRFSEAVAVKGTRSKVAEAWQEGAVDGLAVEPSGVSADDGPERLAVNLFDLERMDPVVRTRLTKGRLDLSRPFQTDKNRDDERAAAFCCPLLEAAVACDMIRSDDRLCGRRPTRLYLRKVKTWSKVSPAAVMTLSSDEGCRLSPVVFPRSVEPVVPAPLAAEAVVMGRPSSADHTCGRKN